MKSVKSEDRPLGAKGSVLNIDTGLLRRLRPVETAAEALAVALIRNECRRWMTHNTHALDVKQQMDFLNHELRRRRPAPRFCLLIVEGRRAPEDWIPMGYAVLRRDRRRLWLTGGLATPFRGQGHGRWLFTTLLRLAEVADWEPWLEVRKSNRRALRLYQSLGYAEVQSSKFKVKKGVLVMRRPRTKNHESTTKP